MSKTFSNYYYPEAYIWELEKQTIDIGLPPNHWDIIQKHTNSTPIVHKFDTANIYQGHVHFIFTLPSPRNPITPTLVETTKGIYIYIPEKAAPTNKPHRNLEQKPNRNSLKLAR
jgi:hypothetical protein